MFSWVVSSCLELSYQTCGRTGCYVALPFAPLCEAVLSNQSPLGYPSGCVHMYSHNNYGLDSQREAHVPQTTTRLIIVAVGCDKILYA